MSEPNGKEVSKPENEELQAALGNVALESAAPQLQGELLYRLQAAWWKREAALGQLRAAQQFARQADAELGQALAAVDQAMGVRIGQTHDINTATWQIVPLPIGPRQV